MRSKLGNLFSILFILISSKSFAAVYPVPSSDNALIGQVQHMNLASGDSIATIGKQYDVGHDAIQSANPQFNFEQDLPSGVPVQVPTQHLLPSLPREGIVVNLPEMRMYYYPAGSDQVLTYPVGIGRIGKTIPIARTAITRKVKDPIWIPPQDIREFNLEQGIVLPRIMPAGPDNPLGPYAIYMKIPTYLIHSTIFPESVGKRASFGCLRMFESDIEDFFPSIEKGVPVVIINSPVKTGWQHDRLYIEAHTPLEEHSSDFNATLPGMIHQVAVSTENAPTLVDWQLVYFLASERDGLPHEVGMKLPATGSPS
jgi:L,D-transpeptidase ErfK/SrfK